MNKLPTVCFLTGTLNAFAGAERMTAVIANALAERGYRVFVLSLWDRASVFQLHPDVVHDALFENRPSFKRHFLATVTGIRRFVRQHKIEVLIEVDTMLTLFTLPATVGMKVRRIAWEHCHFDEDLGRPIRRVARRLAALTCKAVVVLTRRDLHRWRAALRPRSLIAVIGNPLPFPMPPSVARRDSRLVLAVGRLVPEKGFDVLLQAWGSVNLAYPKWRLIIVGEGMARAALEAQVLKLGLSSSVDLPGASVSIGSFYRDAAIFCLSSRYEGFGLVLLEAMAFGLPIVSTDCETGPRELIRDGENGILVPAGDPGALANGLIRVMRDNNLADALADSARDVAKKYTLEDTARCWEELLAPAPDAATH